MVRVESLVACLLLAALTPSYSSASPESIPANEGAAVAGKLAPGLENALAEAASSPGIAIAITLRNDDLPPQKPQPNTFGRSRKSDSSRRSHSQTHSGEVGSRTRPDKATAKHIRAKSEVGPVPTKPQPNTFGRSRA